MTELELTAYRAGKLRPRAAIEALRGLAEGLKDEANNMRSNEVV